MSEQPYRAPIPPAPDPYLAAWADLRRRRRVLWVPALGLLAPAMVLLASNHPAAGLDVLTCMIFVALFSWMYASGFRCPACAQLFAGVDLRKGPPPRRCVHCGVVVGTPKSAVIAAEKAAEPGVS